MAYERPIEGMGTVRRRELLRIAAFGLGTTLAGCQGSEGAGDDRPPTEGGTDTPTETPSDTPTPEFAVDPADLPGYVRPEGAPETVPPPLTCDDEQFERHGGLDQQPRWGTAVTGSLAWEAMPAFEMRVNDLAFERGDAARVTLTNVRDAEWQTGNRYKYNLQVFTEDGWQEVRGWADGRPLPYTDELEGHDPGEGFEWTLTLTETGILDGHFHEKDLTVCPGLPAGRYRFAYWGVDHPVAVAFDLVD